MGALHTLWVEFDDNAGIANVLRVCVSSSPMLERPTPLPPDATASAQPDTAGIAVCAHCDSVVAVPSLSQGEKAVCGRCGHELARFHGWKPGQLLAVCLTAWIMLVHVLGYPLVTLDVHGNLQSTSIWQSILFAWEEGNYLVGWMTFLTAVLLPVAELAVITSAVWCMAMRSSPRMLVWALRAVDVARQWNMLAVFLLGILVALIKLTTIGSLQMGVGLFSTGMLVVLLSILGRLDARTLWQMAEESGLVPVSHLTADMIASAGSHWQQRFLVCHACGMVHDVGQFAQHETPADLDGHKMACMRCSSRLSHRKHHSLERCAALLLTALVFYIPANLLPIMETSSLSNAPAEHTILSGVVDLYRSGSWFIALVVFIASLTVPVIKFVVMGWLLLSIRRGWIGNAGENAVLFRVMELIGQWSMLDVFVVVLLAALVHYDGLMQVKIGPAAWSFGLMVIFTMLAAQHFDPRLLWDGDAAKPSGRRS